MQSRPGLLLAPRAALDGVGEEHHDGEGGDDDGDGFECGVGDGRAGRRQAGLAMVGVDVVRGVRCWRGGWRCRRWWIELGAGRASEIVR